MSVVNIKSFLSLRAPTAKRAVWDAVLVSQQSALAWAVAQKEPKQCGFDPYTTDTPYEGYWCAELTLHAPSNQWRVLYVTNVVTLERWFNIYNIDHWIGWRKVSLAVAPEVHNLPLTNGVTAEKSCVYYKTQENLVIGKISLQASAAAYQEIPVAVLPEGFRPPQDIPFIVASCARKGVTWEGTGWGRIAPDGTIFVYQSITWGWAEAQFSFIAAN